MDKSRPPTTFGVFKPTGHTLMAFHTQEEVRAAVKELSKLGFGARAMVQYSAEEMRAQAQGELQAPSPIANFGYEVDLLRMHKELADQGCAFLLVHAPSESQANVVAALVQQLKPVTAQHYGRFLIQDLTESPPVQ